MYHDNGPSHQLARAEMVARRREAEALRLTREVGGQRRSRRPRRTSDREHRPATERLQPRPWYLAVFARG
jgi:hypothetical protein